MSRPLLFLDTNVFIYFFQKDPQFGKQAKAVFEELSSNKARAVTSVITQVELLSLPLSEKQARQLLELFLETPTLRVEPITSQIALTAAKLRRMHSLRTPDALQLATALNVKANTFVTNDKQLKNFSQIEVRLL